MTWSPSCELYFEWFSNLSSKNVCKSGVSCYFIAFVDWRFAETAGSGSNLKTWVWSLYGIYVQTQCWIGWQDVALSEMPGDPLSSRHRVFQHLPLLLVSVGYDHRAGGFSAWTHCGYMDGQRTTTDVLKDGKDQSMVLVSCAIILPAAFLFSSVAALPHVFLFVLFGLLLSLLVKKTLKYSDRSLIYSFVTR